MFQLRVGDVWEVKPESLCPPSVRYTWEKIRITKLTPGTVQYVVLESSDSSFFKVDDVGSLSHEVFYEWFQKSYVLPINFKGEREIIKCQREYISMNVKK